MKLSYELIDKNNIKLATSIQGTIFPEESAIEHYEYAIYTNYQYCSYYIVKWNNIPVGVTGIYTMNMYDPKPNDDDSVWLGWFGILPEFRSKGIGRQTLLDTIEKSKSYHKKYFRLYTLDTADASARPLYKSIMHTCEKYLNEQDYNYNNDCVIYSYNLQNNKNIELWNNRYAYLNEDMQMEIKSNKRINNYYKIFILLPTNLENFLQFVMLATTFRKDGHFVTIDTRLKEDREFDIIIKENPLISIKNSENINEILKDFKNKLYQNYKK